MDSPLWEVARILHGLPLWHSEPNNPFSITYSLNDWIIYYYNPIGHYLFEKYTFVKKEIIFENRKKSNWYVYE
jgi:hypothetical protein